MGRKKKLVNNTDIPQYAIERVARCVLDDIREDYLKEEVLKAFVEWKENGGHIQLNEDCKKRRRELPARQLSLFYLDLFFPLGPRGFDSGRICQPLPK